MTAIQLQKNWSINPNVRNAFVSLIDMSGWWIYENHAWLKTHGWTVKFTSNGTVGPANNGDTTDRIINKTTASVRGASAVVVQSWTVLTSSDGLQILFAFQGATDDVIRLSYSPGGLYVINVTDSRFQPTATDEVVFCQGNSVVNATASADRVMTIWATDDGTAWSNIAFRAGSTITMLGLERINSAAAPGVFDKPYIAYRYNTFDRSTLGGGLGPVWCPSITAAGVATWFGALARVFTAGAVRLTRIGAGTVCLAAAANITLVAEENFLSNLPALQNGTMALMPLFWNGEKAANLDGFPGAPVDWWVGYTSSPVVPAFNDFFPGFQPADNPNIDPVRTNWFVAIGSTMIRPWKNVAASILAT